MEPVRFIGEIGNNHQGDISIARKMVELLCNAGCWGIKSQKRDIEAHPEWKDKPYGGPHAFGPTYYEHRAALELSLNDHIKLKNMAKVRGVTYFCSAWDLKSAEQMKSIGCDTIKIPSCYSTWWDLLNYCAGEFDRVIISTGMSDADEVNSIFEWVNEQTDRRPVEFVVMMCTSAYPCHPDDIHLSLYDRYRASLDERVHVGFSGHHQGKVIDYGAYTIGCTYIERHVTMDVHAKGSDHSASMEIPEIMSHIRGFDKIRRAFGDCSFRKQILPCEVEPRRKLRDIPKEK